MKKEFYKDYVPKPTKDVDTLGNVKTVSPAPSQPKVKTHKLPDVRDIDDFESFLGESKETIEQGHTTESGAHHEAPQNSAPEHQSAALFANQKNDGNEQRRSAGLDNLRDEKSKDIGPAELSQIDAPQQAQIRSVESGVSGWETYEIELPTLGAVCLSLQTDASGLCFRLTAENPAIEKLLSEKTQKIERQLGDLLKKKVRYIGSERS